MSNRVSENGLTRVAESVVGYSGATTLNDFTAFQLIKETFETTPSGRGWILGTGWNYNVGNKNMEAI